MKSSQEILGLPVLSLEEGKEIGEIQHLVLNPQGGTLDYLLVSDDEWYLGLKVLPFKEVKGIGEFALTVAGVSTLLNISSANDALDLLKKDFDMEEIRVLTQGGRMIGTISEYYLDEESGDILCCELMPMEDEEPLGFISRNSIITYGRDYLVVEEGIEEKLLGSADGSLPEQSFPSAEKEVATSNSPVTQPLAEEDVPVEPVDKDDTQADSLMKHFEEQQRQYLLGKKVSITLLDADGEVIAKEGDIVTAELITKALAADKFTQLTLNVME